MSIGSFTAESGRQDFLNLFVNQLKYQNPLEPVGQEEFLQQLAQMSTVEGLENLNKKFDDLLALETLSSSAELLGLTATYGQFENQSGVIDEVGHNDGQVLVRIGDQLIPMSDVVSVAHTEEPAELTGAELAAEVAAGNSDNGDSGDDEGDSGSE